MVLSSKEATFNKSRKTILDKPIHQVEINTNCSLSMISGQNSSETADPQRQIFKKFPLFKNAAKAGQSVLYD